MQRLAVLLALLAAACSACGGGASADEVLAETASKLPEIQSGTMTMRLVARAGGGEEAGFELEGPFSLAEDGPLPVADITVTQIAGAERGTTRFISTGAKAYLELEGTSYELPPEQFGPDGSGSSEGDEGLGELDIGDWFIEPTVSDGSEVDGEATERVRARLDVVAAVNDLVTVARDLGGVDLAALEGPNAEQLRRTVRAATVDVLTGKDDRLLRSLTMKVDLGVDGPEELRRLLGSLAAAHIDFELTIADPNEPVHVEAPANAVPYPGG